MNLPCITPTDASSQQATRHHDIKTNVTKIWAKIFGNESEITTSNTFEERSKNPKVALLKESEFINASLGTVGLLNM